MHIHVSKDDCDTKIILPENLPSMTPYRVIQPVLLNKI